MNENLLDQLRAQHDLDAVAQQLGSRVVWVEDFDNKVIVVDNCDVILADMRIRPGMVAKVIVDLITEESEA